MDLIKTEKPKRPYWHVDAKWVCALLLFGLLAVTLPIAAIYNLTAKEPATKLVAYALAGMTSPEGIDSDAGMAEIKERIKQNGSETLYIGGVSVTFTADDVNTLSTRELRLKVFSDFSSCFYDQGAEGYAKSHGLDASATDKLKKDSSIISLLTYSTHNLIGKILLCALLIDLLFISGLVLFSCRFGRIVSPGVVLLIVGLPGIVLSILASHNITVTGTARMAGATNFFEMIGGFISYIAPLVLPYFASAYLFVLFSGAALLLVAGFSRIIYAVVQHYGHKIENDSGEKIR